MKIKIVYLFMEQRMYNISYLNEFFEKCMRMLQENI